MAWIGSIANLQSEFAAPRLAALSDYLGSVSRPGPAMRRLLGLQAGQTERIELSAGAFALEQAYLTKARPDGFFESHRRYLDVQVIVTGDEWMELGDAARMTVRQPYDADRDLLLYEDSAGASRLHLLAGDAAVFFPSDVHMPGLCGGAGPALVRKSVIKVPVG